MTVETAHHPPQVCAHRLRRDHPGAVADPIAAPATVALLIMRCAGRAVVDGAFRLRVTPWRVAQVAMQCGRRNAGAAENQANAATATGRSCAQEFLCNLMRSISCKVSAVR